MRTKRPEVIDDPFLIRTEIVHYKVDVKECEIGEKASYAVPGKESQDRANDDAHHEVMSEQVVILPVRNGAEDYTQTVQIMNAVIPIMKIKAIEKMNTNALSTPSAKFDAPENIVPFLYYLNK